MLAYDTAPERLTSEILSGKHTVCVIGLGHVGLPLSLVLAAEGAKVIGVERNEDYLKMLQRGESPIKEHGSNRIAEAVLDASCPNCGVRLLRDASGAFCPNCMREAEIRDGIVRLSGRSHVVAERRGEGNEMQSLLSETTKSGNLSLVRDPVLATKSSDIIIICVGTPIDQGKQPDLRMLQEASKQVGRGLQRGTIVIVKSTVPPGTTEGLVAPLLEKASRLNAGKDFGLAHVPETTLEGLALLGYRTLPKTVGGVDRKSAECAAAVFRVFKAPVYIFDSPKVTEAAKLFQNIYRDVNIALANELALASETIGLDVAAVTEAALTEPKTHLLTPGPGVGGYCLPKDPYYLITPASKAGFRSEIMLTARRVNDGMPAHVVALLRSGYGEAKKKIEGSKIAVLGLSFKANTADIRDSPSLSVIKQMLRLKPKLRIHDPLAALDSIPIAKGVALKSNDLPKVLESAESLVLLTDHLEYRRMNGAYLRKNFPNLLVLIDTRQVFEPEEVRAAGLIYRGVGRT